MTTPTPNAQKGQSPAEAVRLSSRHLLGIEGMSPLEIRALLDRGNHIADHPTDGNSVALHGKTFVNLFYENSTRSRTSFELAAKRLGRSVQHARSTLCCG